MQIVRWEQPAVAMQLMHRRRKRGLPRKHPRLLRRQVALAQIAGRARGDDVFPSGLAALAARDWRLSCYKRMLCGLRKK